MIRLPFELTVVVKSGKLGMVWIALLGQTFEKSPQFCAGVFTGRWRRKWEKAGGEEGWRRENYFNLVVHSLPLLGRGPALGLLT